MNEAKLPPQARDLEESVLGAMMQYKGVIAEIGEFLQPQHFYVEAHQIIYSAIMLLFNTNSPVDELTVAQQLRKTGELERVGGMIYITQLGGSVANFQGAQHKSRIIYEKFLNRELIRISHDTATKAYDPTSDVFQLYDESQSEVFKLFSDNFGRTIDSIEELVLDSLMQLEEPVVEGLVGVGSGFRLLDQLTGGWQKSDLIILGARPAMGKTALALKLARNAAVQFEKPVLVFSLEMSKHQLTNRLLSDESDIWLEKIQKRTAVEWEKGQIEKRSRNLRNIWIDDTPALAVTSFRAKAIRAKKKYGIELIIIDYLQLMKPAAQKKGLNREQEISEISSTLKSVAKELDIPVIALSQLSRALESRPGHSKRPLLSDLRESGSIEQDADQVFFLYRPEYYGLEFDEDNNSTLHVAEVICAKNRHGPTDTVKLHFNGAFMRFSDWDTATAAPQPQENILPSRLFTMPVREQEADDLPF